MKMLPEYFTRRKEVLDEVCSLQYRLAEIRLYGPKTREDLVTIFAIDNGFLDIPDGPLHRPEKWYAGADQTLAGEYKRGLLNLKKAAQLIMPGRSRKERFDPLLGGPVYDHNIGGRNLNGAVSVLDLFGGRGLADLKSGSLDRGLANPIGGLLRR